MLQSQSVDAQLLELLKVLMKSDTFKDFDLVGGTALALQIGHRVSVDIDLFGSKEISETEFTETLSSFGQTILLKKSKNILIYAVNGIKVDFVNYPYAWLEPTKQIENIRMAGLADIAAMKLNAIAGRGSKKDFIDLYFLLQIYPFTKIIDFYIRKYKSASEFMVLKSLTYFDDADGEEMPFMLKEINWDSIKNIITETVKKHLENN